MKRAVCKNDARAQGVVFDGLTFDEGYGRDLPLLRDLDTLGQHYVAEVPSNFRCRATEPKRHSLRREFSTKKVRNVTRWSPAFTYEPWQSVGLIRHMTLCQLVMVFLAEQTARLRGGEILR